MNIRRRTALQVGLIGTVVALYNVMTGKNATQSGERSDEHAAVRHPDQDIVSEAQLATLSLGLPYMTPQRLAPVASRTAGIQEAMAASSRAMLPRDTYQVSETIEIDRGRSIIGISASDTVTGSRIEAAADFPADVFLIHVRADMSQQGLAVRNDMPYSDLDLVGRDSDGSRPNGVLLDGIMSTPHRAHIHGMNIGLQFNAPHNCMNTIYEHHITRCRAAVVIKGGFDTGERQAMTGATINDSDVGIRFDGGVALTLYNSSLDYCRVPIQINYDINDEASSFHLDMIGGHIETNSGVTPGPFVQLSPTQLALYEQSLNKSKRWKLAHITLTNVRLMEAVAEIDNATSWFGPGIYGTVILENCRDQRGRRVNGVMSSWPQPPAEPGSGERIDIWDNAHLTVGMPYFWGATDIAEGYLNVYIGGQSEATLPLAFQVKRAPQSQATGGDYLTFEVPPRSSFKLEYSREFQYSNAVQYTKR